MKLILKSLGVAILYFIVFALLTLLLDNIDGLVVGSFSRNLDIKDWWCELKQDKRINYLIAIAILSGFHCLIYKATIYFTTSRKKFAIWMAFGCVSIFSFTILFWSYIQNHCCDYEWSTLELAFSISYGNDTSLIAFWVVYSDLMFFMGIIANRFDVLIHNKERKIIWHQVYSGTDIFGRMLYEAIPYCILLSGTYILVGYGGLKIKTLFIVFSIGVVLCFWGTKAKQHAELREYYLHIAKDSSKSEQLVVVQESQYIQKSFFIQYLYKTKTLKRMEDKGVFFLPYEMGLTPENFIKLDIYDEWMFIRSAAQKKQILSLMSATRGTFNLAFAIDGLPDSIVGYDGVFTKFENLLNEIERLERYLNYKKIISNELDNIALTKLNKSNCISEEISGFKRCMEILTDDFLSFDYAIKWLEITNYLFGLVGISKSNLLFSEKMQKMLEYADFGKWRSIVDEIVNEDSVLHAIIMTTEDERTAFYEFEKLWNIVTSRQYKFDQYTVKELLDGVNKFRDYTRGHGVFTFEISQTMNIGLIKVLVFLINRLIDYLGSVENIGNLEKNGWIIYSKNVPYYLYSIDKKFSELKYESFQMGNSISLPLDIYG
jgi:hypothetical protein